MTQEKTIKIIKLMAKLIDKSNRVNTARYNYLREISSREPHPSKCQTLHQKMRDEILEKRKYEWNLRNILGKLK